MHYCSLSVFAVGSDNWVICKVHFESSTRVHLAFHSYPWPHLLSVLLHWIVVMLVVVNNPLIPNSSGSALVRTGYKYQMYQKSQEQSIILCSQKILDSQDFLFPGFFAPGNESSTLGGKVSGSKISLELRARHLRDFCSLWDESSWNFWPFVRRYFSVEGTDRPRHAAMYSRVINHKP